MRKKERVRNIDILHEYTTKGADPKDYKGINFLSSVTKLFISENMIMTIVAIS